MNCEWVQQNVPLYLYNELADDARHEVEQHLMRCPECEGELNAMRDFHSAMSALPMPEPSPNLLAAARMRLQEQLEQAQQVRGWRRFVFDPLALLRQVRFSPALASVIFLVGFAGGIGTMYRLRVGGVPAITPETHDVSRAAIGAVRSVDVQPGSDQVSIKFDRVIPEQVQGPVNDPKIQQLLDYAARSNDNSGIRLDSVDVLAKKCDDPRLRETMTYSLRYDSNPGVRLKALEALEPYVKEDIRVRNAVLEALLNDSNPGVRSGAIHMLAKVKADTSVRAALQQLAKEDPNEYIRSESRRLLASLPEID